MAAWQGEPRFLEGTAPADFAPAARSFLPAQTWLRMTGDAGRAAGLLETECIRGCYLVCPPGGEAQALDMFCETLELLNPNGQYPLRPWRHPFTTFLQAEDNPADFQWRACQEGAPACQQAVQRAVPLLPLASVRVPGNSLVKLAREGLKTPAPSQPAVTQRGLPASRTPPPQPITRPGRQPDAFRRSSQWSLIGIKAAILLRLSMLRQWLSKKSVASRASMGIFAAVLLGLMGMRYWGSRHPPAPDGAPTAPSAGAPAAPAAGAGNPDGAPAGPTTAPMPVAAPAEPPDPRQLDWLSADGRTFVISASNFTRFELPVNQIGPFQSLIYRFNLLQTYPRDVQLSVSTNTWDARRGEPMVVKANTHEISAQTASGLRCSFNYGDFLGNPANPVLAATTLAAPPSALSIQFHSSSPTNDEPFRLLIVNESNPPAPMRLSARWLKTNRAASITGLFQEPLGERLRVNLASPQGQKLQLRPFVKSGRQTNYLYENWPAADLPADGQELDFSGLTNRLKENPADAKARSQIEHKRQDLTLLAGNLADYPLGKDLGLPDPLTSFRAWTNAPPVPALFLSYLGELQNEVQKEGPDNTNNGWISRWPPFNSDDSADLLNRNFKILAILWTNNVPVASRNPPFPPNYFSTIWQTLNELENVRQQAHLLEVNSFQERVRRIPASLDAVAYVGLFIVDTNQPGRGLELIRFESP
jgi:hypothetical protein